MIGYITMNKLNIGQDPISRGKITDKNSPPKIDRRKAKWLAASCLVFGVAVGHYGHDIKNALVSFTGANAPTEQQLKDDPKVMVKVVPGEGLYQVIYSVNPKISPAAQYAIEQYLGPKIEDKTLQPGEVIVVPKVEQ